MKEFLQFVARQLVKNPNEVDVQETSGDMVSMLELRVAQEASNCQMLWIRHHQAASLGFCMPLH
jgi:hypothetical protein